MIARDTEVARRLAAVLRASGRRARAVADEHDYGRQLDAQLGLGRLPRADGPDDADCVVLCGLAGSPEADEARALAPLPVIAFDGAQGAELGDERDVLLLSPIAPVAGGPVDALTEGTAAARRAAELVGTAVAAAVATEGSALLLALRAAGPFDATGDPADPPVWLWRADAPWALAPERAL